MSLSEQTRIALLGARQARRALATQIFDSPVLRWAFRPGAGGQLLIVPQDLRTADPSFWQEIVLGQLGLAGSCADIADMSPFEVRPPNIAWERALHGFGWLRHLAASQEPEAVEMARDTVVEWTLRARSAHGVAWEPQVVARRVISWLSHSDFLLEGADATTYDAFARSLAEQVQRLTAGWRGGPDGHQRIVALTAIVLADLCVDGHESHLAGAEHALASELDRQILSDGGHISRNASVAVELLLDLLPLRQCFAARERPVPDALQAALTEMVSMLRYMRMGDGRLARFNGVSVASPAALATVLAYDDRPGVILDSAPASRYVRMQRGGTVILADAGSAPPLEFAGDAHAGCLSFELSSRQHLVIVNGGAPGPQDRDWVARARATASHNTLVLGESSSARLVNNRRVERVLGAIPIQGPDRVTTKLADETGALVWSASHDGYVKRFGLVHSRRIVMSASGSMIEGHDRLAGQQPGFRLATDIPFAVHFHLHPEGRCHAEDGTSSAVIVTPDGEIWRLVSQGLPVTIEESVYCADSTGPRRSMQIVIRGATFGESDIRWRLEQRA